MPLISTIGGGSVRGYGALVSLRPKVTSFTGEIRETASTTLTVTGNNFNLNSEVIIEGAAVSGTPRTLSTTYVSPTQLTANTNATAVNYVSGASFDLTVQNAPGNTDTLSAAGVVDGAPVWTTAAGSLGTFTDATRTSISITVVATDADTVTYGLVSDPDGLFDGTTGNLSLNTSNGNITGSANAVGSNTTRNFTISASADGQSIDRAFSITIQAPVVQTFSYTGNSQTWTKPAGVTSITAYMWGGGGGFGNPGGNVGGAGGYTTGIIDVSSVSSLAMVVGQGGASHDQNFNTGNGNGCGGGVTGIFTSWSTGNVTTSHNNCILAAGAGAGGGNGNTGGGQGGGTTGGKSSPGVQGNAGGQSQGGTYTQDGGGSCTSGSNCSGNTLRGGVACGGAERAGKSGWPNEQWGGIWAAGAGGNGCNAGGGGGGYYGGAGGGPNPNGGAGGGGSGYIGGTGTCPVTGGTTSRSGATGVTPSNNGSSYYGSNAGLGGGSTSQRGFDGRIVILY